MLSVIPLNEGIHESLTGGFFPFGLSSSAGWCGQALHIRPWLQMMLTFQWQGSVIAKSENLDTLLSFQVRREPSVPAAIIVIDPSAARIALAGREPELLEDIEIGRASCRERV